MKRAEILVYGAEDRFLDRLREFGQAHRFWVRDIQQHAACSDLLTKAEADVFVLKIGRDLEQELSLLAHARHCDPDLTCVVVGDVDAPQVEGLAWDLGAHFVIFPPQPIDAVFEVIRRRCERT